MSLSVKYTLYLTLANVLFIASVLMVVWVLFGNNTDRLQTSLRQQTVTAYEDLRQQRLLKAAEFLRKNLFNPVYQADITGVHRAFDEFGLWLTIQQYYITDQQGLLLTDGSATNSNFLKPHDLPLAELKQQTVLIQNTEGAQRLLLSIDFKNKQAGYADIRLTDPEMQLALSQQERNLDSLWMEFRRTVQQVGLYAVVMTLLLSIVLSVLLSHKLAIPLERLSQHARRLADGDFSLLQTQQTSQHELRKGMDELGVLSHAFYSMATRLKDFFTVLEAEVQARTHELTEANQQIQALNQQLHSENRRMGAELDVTRRLQQMLLPRTHELKQIELLDIAGYMEPAEEVGGDYYDVLQGDGRVFFGIGDVTGHGLESGMLMLMVQTAVRTLLASKLDDPQAFLNIINETLYQNVQRMNTDKNLTLLLLDYRDGILKLSGQHEEVLKVAVDGTVERIDTIDLGFIIGLIPDVRRFTQQIQIRLEPGEGLVLYTDGVTEARNDTGEMYGIKRLCQAVQTHWAGSADQIKDAVITDLQSHTLSFQDDITLLVIKQK